MRELLPNVLLQLRNLWILWLKKNSQIVPICLCLWWKRKKQKTQMQKKQKEKDNNKNNKKVLFCVFVSWVFCFLAVWRESNGDDACEEAGTSSSLLCTWEIEQQSYYHWRSSSQDSELQCKLVNNPKTPPSSNPICVYVSLWEIRITIANGNCNCKSECKNPFFLSPTQTDFIHTFVKRFEEVYYDDDAVLQEEFWMAALSSMSIYFCIIFLIDDQYKRILRCSANLINENWVQEFF